ncbi:MAG: hypothetical protein ACR2M1_02370 [Gemmatimonadaceae bacterium]
MIRTLCVAGSISFAALMLATRPALAQTSLQTNTDVDSTAAPLATSARAAAICRPGAYAEVDGGPGPLYVVDEILVGGDSTVQGYIAKVPVYVKAEDINRVKVIKSPEALALYGCRARQGAVQFELKPDVKLRPEWRAVIKAPAVPAPG